MAMPLQHLQRSAWLKNDDPHSAREDISNRTYENRTIWSDANTVDPLSRGFINDNRRRWSPTAQLNICCGSYRTCVYGFTLGSLIVSVVLATVLALYLTSSSSRSPTQSVNTMVTSNLNNSNVITSTTMINTTAPITITTSITTTASLNCTPSCLNGGTCIPTNTCLCIADVWTGTICQTPVRILWPFNNNLNDFYGNFPGTPINGPTYKTPGINGYGACLYLNGSAKQSITILSPPFLNFAYTSFSLSAWVYAATLRNGSYGFDSDNAIFGQFDQNSKDLSLHIIVRNLKIYFGFYSDDTQGSTALQVNTWYHMAYVYDYSSLRQYVYVNGVLDASNTTRGPYKGTKGNLTIGTNAVFAPNNYWDGCLDQISYFSRAKSADEVLRDATLTVYYPFENDLIDNGPLGINGTGVNFQYTSPGKVNSSLTLSSNPSYVQATGLVYLGTVGNSYSLAVWINPIVTIGSTIVHASTNASGISWSMPMIGFSSSGNIVAQSCSSGGAVVLTGPAINAGVWTHVAVTYHSSGNLRLWVNGTQYGSASSAFMYIAAGVPVTLTLGYSLSAAGSCSSSSIVAGQYSGQLDEFYLYSRELNSTNVLSLATV